MGYQGQEPQRESNGRYPERSVSNELTRTQIELARHIPLSDDEYNNNDNGLDNTAEDPAPGIVLGED